MGEIAYNFAERPEREVAHGDIREVNMTVKAVFVWDDNIVTDWDDDGTPLEITSGYVMNVLPNQCKVYSNEETRFIAQTKFEDVKGS